MQSKLILYGTLGCHLCEDAERLLDHLSLSYEYQDIMNDNALLDKFETSIPVLAAGKADTQVLRWPFTKEDIRAWLIAKDLATK